MRILAIATSLERLSSKGLEGLTYYGKKKILITGDDHELHEMNSITASACDLVLSHCPLSVLKYKEKGYESHIIHFEKGIVNKKSYDKKEFDVLFFGALTPSRSDFLNYLVEQGISLKNVGHREGISGLKEEELLKFISKSKMSIFSFNRYGVRVFGIAIQFC